MAPVVSHWSTPPRVDKSGARTIQNRGSAGTKSAKGRLGVSLIRWKGAGADGTEQRAAAPTGVSAGVGVD